MQCNHPNCIKLAKSQYGPHGVCGWHRNWNPNNSIPDQLNLNPNILIESMETNLELAQDELAAFLDEAESELDRIINKRKQLNAELMNIIQIDKKSQLTTLRSRVFRTLNQTFSSVESREKIQEIFSDGTPETLQLSLKEAGLEEFSDDIYFTPIPDSDSLRKELMDLSNKQNKLLLRKQELEYNLQQVEEQVADQRARIKSKVPTGATVVKENEMSDLPNIVKFNGGVANIWVKNGDGDQTAYEQINGTIELSTGEMVLSANGTPVFATRHYGGTFRGAKSSYFPSLLVDRKAKGRKIKFTPFVVIDSTD